MRTYKKLFALMMIALLGFAIFVGGCSRDCFCTTLGCTCGVPTIRIMANADNGHAGQFDESDMEGFFLFRTHIGSGNVDSINIRFRIRPYMVENNCIYWFDTQSFGDEMDFRDYDFLIRNRDISFSLSIDSIEFKVRKEEIFCNRCSPCEDQYMECDRYHDLSLSVDGVKQDSFEVILRK